MPLELEVQFNIVFYALISGLILGIFFDIYRIIRGKKEHKIIRMIQDILFWILSAFIIFTFLLYKNYAFLGTYVYLCMGIGLFIYLKLFSKLVYKIEKVVFNGIKTLLRRGYKNLSYPFRIMLAKFNNK